MSGIDPDGVASELRRTKSRLEQALLDRDQLRRQLSESQKMFHLAAKERQEALGVLTELWACRDAETQEELRRLDLAWKRLQELMVEHWSRVP